VNIKYPIFGKADDRSIFMIDTESKLNYHMENIDVENKEYIGWDSDGRPVEFYLDNNKIRARYLSNESKLGELKQSIFDYARSYKSEVPFDYSGTDVVDLFKAAEEHINQGKFWYKISKNFKNLWKK
jgi:hypothetical protein